MEPICLISYKNDIHINTNVQYLTSWWGFLLKKLEISLLFIKYLAFYGSSNNIIYTVAPVYAMKALRGMEVKLHLFFTIHFHYILTY